MLRDALIYGLQRFSIASDSLMEQFPQWHRKL